jgi:anti-sigma B factor antagonist
VQLTDRDLAVDLSAVTFLDSAGMAALVRGNQAITAAGHKLGTFAEQDNVRRVLEIGGLDKLFHPDGPKAP